jgi:1-deoxy-D-xylulose-5-phosphate synthase
LRFVKPLDEAMLHEVFKNHHKIITIEDGTIMGGAGSAILEFMSEHHYQSELIRMGMPDKYIEHGEPHELYAECNYDVAAIVKTAKNLANKTARKVAATV